MASRFRKSLSVLLLALLARPVGAAGLRTDLRTSFLFAPDSANDGVLSADLRLKGTARPDAGVFLEAHLVESVIHQDAALAALSASDFDYRVAGLDFTHMQGTHSRGVLSVDRLMARLSRGSADWTVGRQPITFGTAFFWNPLDVFHPFVTAALDRDYKPGVDAVRLDLATGDFSGLTSVAVLGQSAKTSSLLLRGHTSTGGWDFALQGGRVSHGAQLGGSLVGDFDGLEVRAEASQFWATDDLRTGLLEDHFFGVFGVGRRLDNGLQLEAELARNTLGSDGADMRAQALQAAGAMPNLGRTMLAGSASYELSPLVTGRLALVHSLSDHSTLLQPDLTISLSDEVDAVFSASIHAGDRNSEYGRQADSLFLQFRAAF